MIFWDAREKRGSDIVCRPSTQRYREEEGLYRSNDGFMGVLGLRILGDKKPEFTGSSIEIVENGARAELYTKY